MGQSFSFSRELLAFLFMDSMFTNRRGSWEEPWETLLRKTSDPETTVTTVPLHS
jgi:hypothetical protein